MTETQRCTFCRREQPINGPVCGPHDNQPCRCCGLEIVAVAPPIIREDPEGEGENQEQE